MGGNQSCQFFTYVPVWYEDDNTGANFNDWNNQSFGGWTKPYLKEYQLNYQSCGVNVNQNYY
jgi:hypothetical protein